MYRGFKILYDIEVLVSNFDYIVDFIEKFDFVLILSFCFK